MKILVTITIFCIVGTYFTQAASHKKSHRLKSKSERKRNIDFGSTNTGYNSPAALEQAASNAYASALAIRQNIPGPPPQNPPVFDALDILRGRPPFTAKEATDVLAYAAGGKDFPAYLEIPKTYFSCSSAKPGMYADLDHYCQVYHRCDIAGKQSTYLCPPKTLFNQITLVCDWFYNVNCPNSRQFIEYSNSRLYYPTWQVLDTQLNYIQPYVQPQVQQSYIQSQPQPQVPQPPPVLYPGRPSNQMYSPNINGHENPEYQMSVVIRNPQMIPDYNVGESNLMPNKEQMDQGSTVVPLMSANGSGNNQPEHSETVVVDTPQASQHQGGSVNVTIDLNEQTPSNQQRPSPILNQRFTL